ncbi:uncharacterized protein IL334_002393 [Kwoniella shivajii]|uniref:Ecp2 effector protein domain-containing protein n=1 Tax=Kwoniella shivajii TaxID=564305 RepID=A0ABZ1CWA7_9TREE|nr:hypothetical protein IL334_002393 [Kwoniella shivajii]
MFTLTSTTVLFSILLNLAQAAPLPMPAVKQSEQLASRFYNHPDSIFSQQTACWDNGVQGILRDNTCILAALNVEGSHYTSTHQPSFVQGQPCTLNGQPGYWQDAVCILANLDVDLHKKDFIPFQGRECWSNGRRGYFRQDGLCDIIDLDLIADVNNGNNPSVLNNGLPAAVPFGGKPCWVNGNQGLWQNDLCVLADLDLAKRYSTSGGIVSDVIDTLTSYEDCINCASGFTRTHHAVLATDNIVDAEALVDVNRLHNAPYKRNGLLHNAPDGNELDGATRTVTQLLDHTITKRGLLGLNDLPVVSQGNTYYPNGYVQPVPVVDHTIADITAEVNVDEGDEPYYGRNHPHTLNNNLLGLKRDVLGGNDNTLNILSTLGDVLESHRKYPSDEYVQTPNGNIIPFDGASGVLAQVEATVDVDGVNNNKFGSVYPTHSRGGLLGRNLGGLSGVDGLGLNKDGSFPEGLNAVPVVGDLLGAGKGDGALEGLGKGSNGLSHIL